MFAHGRSKHKLENGHVFFHISSSKLKKNKKMNFRLLEDSYLLYQKGTYGDPLRTDMNFFTRDGSTLFNSARYFVTVVRLIVASYLRNCW